MCKILHFKLPVEIIWLLFCHNIILRTIFEFCNSVEHCSNARILVSLSNTRQHCIGPSIYDKIGYHERKRSPRIQ